MNHPRLSVFLLLLALRLASPLSSQQPATPANLVTIDAKAPITPPETGFLHLGGQSSTGHSLQVNSRYLTLDGKPWLPVMGEIHYTRIPEDHWEAEILKMKAAGVNIIATYVFWIHHEEIEGQFDWSGRRNLRQFVQLCAKHGMYVYLRPGPWAHGEVRNGGFPDWLNKLPNIRTNDPVYLEHVSQFFSQIGQQLQGLMWKDGGPVVGAQLENEYSEHGPGRGAEHILRLKQLAIAAGIDPPLFSVTGWPSLDFPAHEVLPVSGGYPDGFWYGSQTALPPSMNYLFNFNRQLGDMGATVPSTDPSGKVDLRHDPYFDAEQAGGMATSYHRRPVLSADDIAALTLVGIGSGVNLYGYYMFHGGTNPLGKLSTLQESQATGYPNDLPEVDYDFQAPIGAFGQIRDSYRKTRLMHLFLNAYGSQLAPMPAIGPAPPAMLSIEAAAADVATPRVAIRTDGKSGYIFVNNYVRQLAMPARPGFQVSLQLPAGELRVPRLPLNIPAGAYFHWPFNLALGNARLQYSTAQQLTRIQTPQGTTTVFFAIPGIEAEFSFDPATVRSLKAPGAHIARSGSAWLVDRLTPGLNTTIQITDRHGTTSTLLLLTQEQAEHCAIVRSSQQEFLALTDSDLFQDGDQLHLRSTRSPGQQISLYPPLREDGIAVSLPAAAEHGQPLQSVQTGLWSRITVTQPARDFKLNITPGQPAAPRQSMAMGPPVAWRDGPVPQAPADSAFAQAARWQLGINEPNTQPSPAPAQHPETSTRFDGLSQLFLQIRYTGDIAHLASQGALLDDNFYNGLPWQIGLKSSSQAAPGSAPDSVLTLEILPMPAVAPIYLDDQARQLLHQHPGAQLLDATLLPQYESIFTLAPTR